MKRTPFKRKAPPAHQARQWAGHDIDTSAAPCRMASAAARMSVPVPKQLPWRSEAYRRAVAALNCAHCHRPGRSQCAHADTLGGKGMGIKVSDALTYPACADEPGRRGCHALLSLDFAHRLRKTLETRYVDQTQQTLAHLLPTVKE